MAKVTIAGNWKMNTTVAESRALASELRPALDEIGGVSKIVCPPFVSITAVAEVMRGSSVSVGAQNLHHEAGGAFTGEVSAPMLAGLCSYVILGHSERRQHFGETDDSVNAKVKAALEAGIRPIVCVGEQLAERDDGRAEAVVERQVRGGLAGVDSAQTLIVAYEPVWAIGTGRAATPELAQSMMSLIRRVLSDLFGPAAAADVPLQYGGSVTPDNAAEIAAKPDIDGALVGGASLKAASFVGIVRGFAQASA